MNEETTNFLAEGIEIIGTIRFSNDMHIDGKVDGEIHSDKGRVTIGDKAIIRGDITAGDVRIYGQVEGKIQSDRCEIKRNAVLNGDVVTKALAMEEGAKLMGRTEIG